MKIGPGLGWERTEAWSRTTAQAGRMLLRHTKVLDHAMEAAENLTGSSAAFGVGLGAAEITLGAVDLTQGVAAWQQGKKLQGALNLGGGAANLISGAVLIGQVAYHGSCSLDGVGAAASGVGALLDGLEDFTDSSQRSLSGAVKVAGGGLLLAGALASAPQVSAAGSLLYLTGMGVDHGPDLYDWVKASAR